MKTEPKTKKTISKNSLFLDALDYFDWSRAKEFLTQNRLADLDEAASYIEQEITPSVRNYYGQTENNNKMLIESIDKKAYYSTELWNKIDRADNEGLRFLLNYLLKSKYLDNRNLLIETIENSTNAKLKEILHENSFYKALNDALEVGQAHQLGSIIPSEYIYGRRKPKPQMSIDSNSMDFDKILKMIKTNYEHKVFQDLHDFGLDTFDKFKEAIDRPHASPNSIFKASFALLSMYQQFVNLPKIILNPTKEKLEAIFSNSYYDNSADVREMIVDFFTQEKILVLQSPGFKKTLAEALFDSTYRGGSYSSYRIHELTPKLYKFVSDNITKQDVIDYLRPSHKEISENDHPKFTFIQKLHKEGHLKKLDNTDFWNYLTTTPKTPLADFYIFYLKEFFEPEKLETTFSNSLQYNTPDDKDTFLGKLNSFTLKNKKYLESLNAWTNKESIENFLTSFFEDNLTNIDKNLSLLPASWSSQYPDNLSFVKHYARSYLSHEADLKEVFKNPDYKFLLKDPDLVERALTEGWGKDLFEFSAKKYKVIASDEVLNNLYLKVLDMNTATHSYRYSEYAENPKSLLHDPEHTARLCHAHPTLYRYLHEHQWDNIALVEQIIKNVRTQKSPEETISFLRTKSNYSAAKIFSVIETQYTKATTSEREKFDVLNAYQAIIQSLKTQPAPPAKYVLK